MPIRSIVMTTVLATLATASNIAGAADANQGKGVAAGSSGMERTDKDHGMMQDGMMGGGPRSGMMPDGTMPRGMMHGDMMQGGTMPGGMMGMMNGCQAMTSSPMMSRLPAGNEKLQLQMHAEMMQKMGEILGRYADKIK
jgi:hypothetical protein